MSTGCVEYILIFLFLFWERSEVVMETLSCCPPPPPQVTWIYRNSLTDRTGSVSTIAIQIPLQKVKGGRRIPDHLHHQHTAHSKLYTVYPHNNPMNQVTNIFNVDVLMLTGRQRLNHHDLSNTEHWVPPTEFKGSSGSSSGFPLNMYTVPYTI